MSTIRQPSYVTVRYGPPTAPPSPTPATRYAPFWPGQEPPHHQISQDTQIVVSELVTNALRHAPGPGGLLLEVLTTPARLRVTVRDTSRASPRLRVPDPHRIGGHGLHLITRLCSHFHTSPRDDGKQVTAEMLLPQPAL